jgi:hypothetical protein
MSTQFRSDDTQKWWLGFGDGSDGVYSSTGNATDAPVDSSCSGTAGATSLSATNASFTALKPVLIHQTRGTGAGNWELNQIQSYTTGTITLKKPLQNTYTDSGVSQAQVIQLKQYSSFTQNSGHTLTAKAWNGDVGGIIAFLCKETVTINGTIDISGCGFLGGAPGTSPGSGQTQSGFSGESYNSAQNANGGGIGASGGGSISPNTTAQFNAGSGGRASRGTDAASGGGGGGHSASGSNGVNVTTSPSYNGGYGGGTGGNSGLTTMIFGGGAGGPGGWHDAGAGTAANHYGGKGAGAMILIAKNIVINGYLYSNGANGANGGNARGGGGGGAGGSILLKAVNATLGTTRVTATGGSGGSANGNGTAGGAGAVGRIHIDYSGSVTGTTNPTLSSRFDPTIKPKSGGGILYTNFF